jgi:hypothetical protein
MKPKTKNARARENMLCDIATELRALDDSHKIDGTHHKVELWRVEVVLFDANGVVLAVAPLMRALAWIVDEVHQIEDTTDISAARSAHVQIRDGKCFGPMCKRAHE